MLDFNNIYENAYRGADCIACLLFSEAQVAEAEGYVEAADALGAFARDWQGIAYYLEGDNIGAAREMSLDLEAPSLAYVTANGVTAEQRYALTVALSLPDAGLVAAKGAQ